MITALNAKNQDAYLKLFEEASKLLVEKGDLEPAYGLVNGNGKMDPDTYVAGVYYTRSEETNADGEFVKYVYALATGEYDASKEYYFETSAITTLEEYFCNLRNLYDLQIKDKFLMLPLDEDMFEIDANTRAINVPASFRKAGIGVQGDTIAETILFKVDRFFDAMDLSKTQIFVQWETAGKNPEQYVTPIEMIDTETYADESKFVFGWPISDNLTLTSGNIKFAVRFIKMDDENKIVYSLSTLTAQAIINPGLNFDLITAKQDDHASSLFENAIENSESTVGPQAAPPIFVNEVQTPVIMEKTSAEGAEVAVYGSEIRMTVAVEDLGNVTYKWYYKKNADAARKFLGAEAAADAVMPEGKNHLVRSVFEKTKDTAYNANKNYFVADAESVRGYKRYTGGAEGFNPAVLFERFSVLTIAGDLNDIGENGESPVSGYYYVEATNRTGTREKTTKSKPSVEVPAPEAPVIITDLGKHQIVEKGKTTVLSVVATADKEAEVTYNWKYSGDKAAWVAETGSTGAEISVDDIGYYKADIVSLMNLGRTSTETGIVKVTNPPMAPEFAEGFRDIDKDIVINARDDKEIAIALTNAIDESNELYSEGIKYIWMQDDDNNPDTAMVEYLVTEEPSMPVSSPWTGPQKIRCIAENTLSGKTARSQQSCLFVIIEA